MTAKALTCSNLLYGLALTPRKRFDGKAAVTCSAGAAIKKKADSTYKASGMTVSVRYAPLCRLRQCALRLSNRLKSLPQY